MNAYVLGLLADWGAPFLFVLLFLAAFGLPLPATLTLIAAGAFIAAESLDLAPVFAWSVLGAIAGDHAGYLAGRLAGVPIEGMAATRPKMARQIRAARAFMDKRGMAGVFLTRWLAAPIGPPVNLAAGIAHFAPVKFGLAVIAGETLWVALYLGLGATIGAASEDIAALAGDFGWLAVLGAATGFLGWKLFRPKKAIPPRQT